MDKLWLETYKEVGIRPEIVLPAENTSLIDIFERNFQKFGSHDAFVCMNKRLTFRDVDQESRAFSAYLQSLGLKKGARVAIMLPNILQYPIAMIGILRSGMILVNVNPLYTARELEHQLQDAGAEVLVILDKFASVFAEVAENTPVRQVIVATVGDLLGFPKGLVVNSVLKYVRKEIPTYNLSNTIGFNKVVAKGQKLPYTRPQLTLNDTAVLQYTGGTTGVAKGAELTHKNLLANLLQVDALFVSVFGESDEARSTMCALPLYHIFAFTVCAMYGMYKGGMNILIPNPRDIAGLVKEFDQYKPAFFPAVNTLFNALANNDGFKSLDHSGLKISMGGGMAVMPATATAWQKLVGHPIIEGYGLSETSPVATANPPNIKEYTGMIGIPMPSTDVIILDDDGQPVAQGERGELCIRGPQVMKGYWQRTDETANVMTADGFFRSGDIGIMDERGFFKIVDRKKDMILVSGFNVYPNEIEEVITHHPKVLEAAAIGVPDEKSGEVPKLFVVKKDDSLTEQELMAYAKENLTGYKRPRYVEFVKDLPKSNVGKILRKELRKDIPHT